MTVNFGLDLFCDGDFLPTMPDVTGRQVPLQRLVRRLFTPQGSCPDCPNDGIDLRDYLNKPTIPQEVVQGLIAGELLKDPACSPPVIVKVTLSGPYQKRTMGVEINGQLSDGPFSLVLSVNDLTVQLISAK